MSEQKNKVTERKVERIEKISYWAIVWSQLIKNKLAVVGIWAVVFLVLLAIFAPLVSLNRPFWFFVPAGEHGVNLKGSMSYPFINALFDQNLFENGVDIFFNTLMVLTPLMVIIWFIAKAAMGANFKEQQGNLIMAFIILQIVVFGVLWGPMARHDRYFNYRQTIADLEAKGVSPSYCFPVYNFSFREVDAEREHPLPPSSEHLCGTDREGRDVFVRMVYGTRISLTIGVVAVSIYVTIGVILGSLAGYFGGWVDMFISRFVEIMLCFPAFFLILTLAAFIEKRSIFHVMAIIGLTRWTGVARLVRGEFLRQRNLDYVQAAIALGLSKPRIIFGHILPNAIAPVLVSATFGVARAILTESSLSFLGLGDLTAPSWGGILSAGRAEGKLWLILVPGFAIFFVVSVFNLVGEGLRDALDPKLRQ